MKILSISRFLDMTFVHLACMKRYTVRLFQSLKRNKIRQFNLKQINLKVPRFERERSQRKCEGLVMCSLCHGFYSKSYYSRHTNVCGKDSFISKCAVPFGILVDKSQEGLSENFKTEILQVIRDDTIAIIAKSDQTISMIGSGYESTLLFEIGSGYESTLLFDDWVWVRKYFTFR